MECRPFVIPVDRTELLNVQNVKDRYCVQKLLNPGEISSKIRVCCESFSKKKSQLILEEFDTLFSVVYHAHGIQSNYVLRASELNLRAMDHFCDSLSTNIRHSLNERDRNELQNISKMITYLFSELYGVLHEKVVMHTESEMAIDAKSRKKANKAFSEFDWRDVRQSYFNRLHRFVQSPLPQLWNPPIAPEDFVNLIANCCYKALEEPTISHVDSLDLREKLNSIIGTLISQYNHGLSCVLKTVQLLKIYDHLAAPLAEAAILFVHEFGCNTFIREAIKEISENELESDSNLPKGFLQFLIELSQTSPEDVLPLMDYLLPQLDNESPGMRSCILSVIGELISKSLRGENLSTQQREERDLLFDHLEEHMYDTNAIVRSKVFKVLHNLCLANAIPLARIHNVVSKATERVGDANWSVTRQAIQFLQVMLSNNPFSSKLNSQEAFEDLHKEFEVLGKLEEKANKMTTNEWITAGPKFALELEDILSTENFEVVPEAQNKSIDDMLDLVYLYIRNNQYRRATFVLLMIDQQLPNKRRNLVLNQKVDFYLKSIKKCFFKAFEDDDEKEVPKELQKQQQRIEYYKHEVDFIEQVEKATEAIEELLLETTQQVSVIVDVIDFITSAHMFKIKAALTGVKNMLLLVFSEEPGVREKVASSYHKIYLDFDRKMPARSRAALIVQNLSQLIENLDKSLKHALETLVTEWVKKEDLDEACVQLMWERFTKSLPNTSDEESLAALGLLSMVANADPLIIKANVDVLLDVGLGERGRKDSRLAAETCNALSKLHKKSNAADKFDPPVRYEKDHKMFHVIVNVLQDGFLNLSDIYYFELGITAMNVIYKLAEQPEDICRDLMINLDSQLRSFSSSGQQTSKALSRFVFFIGDFAFKQYLHLDGPVFVELKRRNEIRHVYEQKQRKSTVTNLLRKSLNVSRASDSSRSRKEKEDPTDMDETIADDMDANAIQNVCEDELLSENNLLGKLSLFVAEICKDPVKYSDFDLKREAVSALTKCMTVSPKFCESQLQLLFTISRKSNEAVIRSKIVLAIGDLTNRFPNVLEPWTKHIYERLQDEDSEVRLNTLVVLKHLIMNEMVKVRGHISKIALNIVDEDERISRMASEFFETLAKKGNQLYNVMPDLISTLCDSSLKLSEEHFHTIFKFLMPLIQKERQMESLVDKLCQRFKILTSERQWSDLAFCLSLLQYSERGLSRLSENFSCYSNTLHDQGVYSAFKAITSQCIKSGKPERKVAAEELLAKLENHLKPYKHKKKNDVDVSENDGQTGTDDEESSPRVERFQPKRRTRKQAAAEDENLVAEKLARLQTSRTKKTRCISSSGESSESSTDESKSDLSNSKRQSKRKRR